MKSIKEISIQSRNVDLVGESTSVYSTKICDPVMVGRAFHTILPHVDCEHFVVLPLDNSNRPLGIEVVAKGAPEFCPVDVRMVFRSAIVLGASSVIIAHNHPSGSLEPSEEDIGLSRRLLSAGRLLSVEVMDHVIVTDSGVSSIRELKPEMWSK